MRLRTGLFWTQVPLGVALLVLAVVAGLTVSRLGRNADDILRDNYRSVLAAQRMAEAIERLDSAALLVAAGRPERAREVVETHRPIFASELAVARSNITEPDEAEAAAALAQAWRAYQEAYAGFAAGDDYFVELEPSFRRVKQANQAILHINQDAMVRKSEKARRESETALALVLAVAVLACGAAAWASATLGRRLLRPVAVLGRTVARIGAGDLKARAQLVGTDELVRLSTDFNLMADKLQEYRRSSLGDLLAAQHAAQAAIDSLPDAVVILDLAGGVLNVNQAAHALLGIDEASTLAGVPPALREAIDSARQHVVAGKGAFAPRGLEDAVRLAHAEGERALLPRATPVYADEGGLAGVAIVLQDVSRLLRFDQLKNDLVATVAHELRTPLTSLRMAIHLCAEETVGPLTEKQADLLFAARDDCARLQNIVDELLDLSRIQAGQTQLERRPVTAEELVEDAIAAHRFAAREAGLELRREVAAGLPSLDVDPERLQIVFANLLANAFRHTPREGHIALRALGGEARVRFEVADSGPGVPEAEQARVFEKFARGASSGGSGLGLFIAREIVSAHGGTIGVESPPGQGATFWFELPAKG